jgi:hypothetical protein
MSQPYAAKTRDVAAEAAARRHRVEIGRAAGESDSDPARSGQPRPQLAEVVAPDAHVGRVVDRVDHQHHPLVRRLGRRLEGNDDLVDR